MNKFNESWEEDVLKKIPDGINVIKNELSPLLNEKLRSESVIDNSIDQIVDSPQTGFSEGQSNEKAKVRTIGARTPDGMMPKMVTSQNDTVSTRPMAGGANSFEDIDTSLWRGGYSDTLILVGTAVLVLLVFMVSFVMFNYFM